MRTSGRDDTGKRLSLSGSLIVFSWRTSEQFHPFLNAFDGEPDHVVIVDPLASKRAGAAAVFGAASENTVVEAVPCAENSQFRLIEYSAPGVFKLSDVERPAPPPPYELSEVARHEVEKITVAQLLEVQDAVQAPTSIIIDMIGLEASILDMLKETELWDGIRSIVVRCGPKHVCQRALSPQQLRNRLQAAQFNTVASLDGDSEWPSLVFTVDPKSRQIAQLTGFLEELETENAAQRDELSTLRAKFSNLEKDAADQIVTQKSQRENVQIELARLKGEFQDFRKNNEARLSESEARCATALEALAQAQGLHQMAQTDMKDLRDRFSKVESARMAQMDLLARVLPKLEVANAALQNTEHSAGMIVAEADEDLTIEGTFTSDFGRSLLSKLGPNEISETLEIFEDAIETLQTVFPANTVGHDESSLGHLLESFEAIQSSSDHNPPVRIVQHFACTGGTLMSRALSVQPNTMFLSEIDPLSTLVVNRDRPAFAPSDLIYALRQALRETDETVMSEMFLAELNVLQSAMVRQGFNLVLRDHAHSHYCTERDPASRPSLRGLVSRQLPVRAILTIRHPLDTYLSLVANGWHEKILPSTLDEYAKRYLQFLDDNRGVTRIKYEDFLSDTSATVKQMCNELDLSFQEANIDLLSLVSMSGNSGRSGTTIQARPRRDVPGWIGSDVKNSSAYRELCKALDYDLE